MPSVSVKRGANPSPRSVLAAATPYRGGRRPGVRQDALGTPANFITKPQRLSFWGNDNYGDCVTAEEAFAKACNTPKIFLSDEEVVAWAARHGYPDGAYLTPVMTTMQRDGFVDGLQTYDDGSYVSVDWTDAALLQSAISEGPVKLGVAADQLEAAHATTNASGWFGTGFHADGAEDHCVSLCGYGSISWLAQQLGVHVPSAVDGTKPGYALFTWGTIGIVDVPSMIAITHEAWLRAPTSVLRPVPTPGICELAIDPATGGWKTAFNLTAELVSPEAVDDPRGYLGVVPRVVYRAANGHIHEFAIGPNGQWEHGDLTAGLGAPVAIGDPFGYLGVVPRVIYRT